MTKSFAEKVHKVVIAIPKGSVKSYSEVAELAGSPKASRVVANLMAKNFDTNIPCHRVIRKDGTLGGYNRGGIEKKREILTKEGYIWT